MRAQVVSVGAMCGLLGLLLGVLLARSVTPPTQAVAAARAVPPPAIQPADYQRPVSQTVMVNELLDWLEARPTGTRLVLHAYDCTNADADPAVWYVVPPKER